MNTIPLSIAAACGKGKMRMKGLGELRFKESNRFLAIEEGLQKCGVIVNTIGDNMITDKEEWNEDWQNFSPDEVKCQHCGELKIDEELMDLIQEARETLGPLRITSGYKTF